jgi:predicted ATPase/DNA-binding SARP family transcriptional activator
MRGGPIELRLLGAVEAVVGDRPVAFAGAKQRALVALLASSPGQVVSTDRIIDAVWGEDAPPTVRSSLQVHVSQIRRALTDAVAADVVVTRAPGYVLDVAPEAVDVVRFERSAAEARAALGGGDPGAAAAAARAALALWRGRPLGGVGDAPFAEPLAVQLEQRRAELVEVLADAEVSLGRPGEVIAALEELVVEQPYRESAWERLAACLYRTGRQVEALARLATLRRLLVDDLGLDPGPAIVALEGSILRHELEAVEGPAPAPSVLKQRSQLPPARPLIGREALIADAVDEVQPGRVVSLVGPGGVGKTSVARHVAARSVERFVDGALFVELAGVHDPGMVPTAVAVALGARVEGDRAELADVVQLVRDRSLLVCLDNAEHLVDAVAELAGALADDAGIAVLVTSQEVLAIASEVVIDVPSLAPAEAMELFVACARAADRSFAVEAGDAAVVEEICRRLDGLPLGVELVAARARTLAPGQLLAQLDGTTLLGAGRRGAVDRHRTLEAAVRWSYELLDPVRRQVLDRLSVFDAPVDLDGVIAVCADEPDGCTGGRRVVDELDALCSRSLVAVERGEAGHRFRLLATIRAFAATRLVAADDREAVVDRFVDHVEAWGRKLRPIIESGDPGPGVRELERGAAHLRGAWTECLRRDDVARAERVIAAIGPIALAATTALPDLSAWIGRTGIDTRQTPRARLDVLLVAMWGSNRHRAAVPAMANEAERLARDLDDPVAEVFSVAVHAEGVFNDDRELALSLIQRAKRLSTKAVPPPYLASLGSLELNILLRARQLDDAGALLDQILAGGSHQYGLYEANLHYQAGRLARQRGDLDRAEEWFESGIRAARRTGSTPALEYPMFGLADLALQRGDPAAAKRLLDQAIDISTIVSPDETWGDRLLMVRACVALGLLDEAAEHVARLAESELPMFMTAHSHAAGLLAAASGRPVAAETLLVEAIGRWAAVPSVVAVGDAVTDLAGIVQDPTRAAELRALASQVRDGSTSLDEVVDAVRHPD